MLQSRFARLFLILAVAGGTSALGQFQTLVTDFDNGAWTPFVTEVMFKNPSFSPSTLGLDPNDGDLTYLTDVSIDTLSVAHSGSRSSAIYWGWSFPAYHTNWVRLSTFNSTVLPNPAVHLGGKVKFWAAAKAYTSSSFATPVSNGHLLLGIGLRETGEGAPLGTNGGIVGDIEWALEKRLSEIFSGTDGLCNTSVAVDSDDVQLVPVGNAAGADAPCIGAGPDGILQTAAAGDDVVRTTPIGLYSIPTDGVMRQYTFDLAALAAAGKIFAFSGDGVLNATPNFRGTLDHIVVTNDPTNGALGAKVMLLNIDDVTFESPVLDPPVIEEPFPLPLAEEVTVGSIKPTATLVEVVRLDANGDTLIGSLNPAGQTVVTVPTTPLASNIKVVARQTAGGNLSDNSTPVVITPPGNGPLRIAMGLRETDEYDHALGCGGDGTGFNANQPSTIEFVGASGQQAFGVPVAPRFPMSLDWMEVTFNPCDETNGVAQFSGDGALAVNPAPDYTVGVFEGLYFRIDEFSPTTGPYTLYIDDLVVKEGGNVICVVDDFESYTPADFVVEPATGNLTADTVAAPTDVQLVSPGSTTFIGQKIVGPGADGTLETVPGGDDIILPLSARFNQPTVAGTSVGVASTPDRAAVTDEVAFSGTQSLKVEFAFLDAANLQSTLRLTTNGSTATNPPQTLVGPDPVIRISNDGTYCDGVNDITYSFHLLLAPPQIPGDCDGDGDVDLHDVGCLQECISANPPTGVCVNFDIAPNGAPDGTVNKNDVLLFQYLIIGPAQ